MQENDQYQNKYFSESGARFDLNILKSDLAVNQMDFEVNALFRNTTA